MRHQFSMTVVTDASTVQVLVTLQPYDDFGRKQAPRNLSCDTYTGEDRFEAAAARARKLAHQLVLEQAESDANDRADGPRP